MPDEIKLSKEDIEGLKASGEGFTFLRKELNKMKKAGIDITVQLKQLDERDKLRKGLIREYGNGE